MKAKPATEWAKTCTRFVLNKSQFCLCAWADCCTHQCTAGISPVCIWILEFYTFILFIYFFYYTVPSVPSHWLEMGCTNNKTKTCLKEGVAERLKLLLIHYLRIHHVLVSAPFKQVFKHSLGGKATKSVRGSFFHQLLGSVELHAPREAWLWRV